MAGSESTATATVASHIFFIVFLRLFRDVRHVAPLQRHIAPPHTANVSIYELFGDSIMRAKKRAEPT